MTSEAHRLEMRIYYEDTDFSGVVYHANYLRFLERGRTEMLRALGVDQAALFASDPPVAFAVARLEIEFRRPARMDDVVTVETRVLGTSGASATLHQRLTRATDVLVEAVVKVATVSRGRAVRFPRDVASRLRTASASPA